MGTKNGGIKGVQKIKYIVDPNVNEKAAIEKGRER